MLLSVQVPSLLNLGYLNLQKFGISELQSLFPTVPPKTPCVVGVSMSAAVFAQGVYSPIAVQNLRTFVDIKQKCPHVLLTINGKVETPRLHVVL